MKETIKERKQKLYDLTTKARNHYLAVEKRVSTKIKRENPTLEWWEQAHLVYQDPDYIKAVERLYALCDACAVMGIECGE